VTRLRAVLMAGLLLAAPAAATAMTLTQYRTLQANVGNAFLWAYLYKNAENISPASGQTRYIGAQIVRATGNTFFFHCKFYRLKSPAANAISSPDGSIFLYSGLDRLKLTKNEKAAIIAHEVAHLARSHWLARLQRGLQAQMVAAYAAKKYGARSAAISLLYSKIRGLSYDRDQEYEADAYGAQFMLDAGYPPQAMVSLLKKLDADQREHATAATVAPYLQDHPLTPDRIARLERLIPTLHRRVPHLRPMKL
jgi:predicted Zn-dependent protease